MGAAALVALDGDGRCTEARIAITAVARTVLRVEAAEQIMRGHAPTAEIIAAAAAAAGDAARPIDDVRASAHYRSRDGAGPRPPRHRGGARAGAGGRRMKVGATLTVNDVPYEVAVEPSTRSSIRSGSSA